MTYKFITRQKILVLEVNKLTHGSYIQKLVIAPVKKEVGLAFKGNQKNVVEALEVNDKIDF